MPLGVSRRQEAALEETPLDPGSVHSLLHLGVLTSFVCAQPLYDLLGSQGVLFVSHRANGGDLLIVCLVLSVAAPLIQWLVLKCVSAIRLEASRVLFLLALVILASIGTAMGLKRAPGLGDAAILAISALCGCGFAQLYRRRKWLRTLLSALAPSVLLFPILFFMQPGISRIAMPEEPSPLDPGSIGLATTPPVVVVIFDELPVVSLLDGRGDIDRGRFPHFGRLAEASSWYTRTTTIHPGTHIAVPAILTGRYPIELREKLPVASDHPESVFTFFAGAGYAIEAVEPLTELCPANLCGDGEETEPRAERVRAILSDLGVVYLHLALPERIAATLPRIDETWRGFGRGDRATWDRNRLRALVAGGDAPKAVVNRCLAKLNSGGDPTLHVFHLPIPHVPWRYFPSGNDYSSQGRDVIDGLESGGRWGEAQWAIDQAHRRHLLQVGYTDNVLGQIMDRMEALGLLDGALLVVTADHGASFRSGDGRRFLSDSNERDILPVPLFVKAPFQRQGRRIEAALETVDIFPIMVATLGGKIPWTIDGRAVQEGVDGRQKRNVYPEEGKGPPRTLPPDFDHDPDTLRHKEEIFGSGSWDAVFRIGAYPTLLGADPSGLSVLRAEEFTGRVEHGELLQEFDRAPGRTPAHIKGQITQPAGVRADSVAVGINGRIRGVTQLLPPKGRTRKFQLLLPEESLTSGANRLELFAVTGPPERPVLHEVRLETTLRHPLQGSAGGASLGD